MTSTACFAARARAIGSSWSKAHRSAGTVRAWRCCSAQPAQAAGPYAAGVIMTGMGDDGAGGLLEMRESWVAHDRSERGDVHRLRHAARGHSPRRGQAHHAARLDRGGGSGLGCSIGIGFVALS